MAGDVARRLFEIEELREHTWNPLLANPGSAIYMLLARDYAPLPERLHSLAGRLARVPDVLAAARGTLGRMPKVHLETAITQFSGTIALVTERGGRGRGRRRGGGPRSTGPGRPRSRRWWRTATGSPPGWPRPPPGRARTRAGPTARSASPTPGSARSCSPASSR